MHRLRHRRLRLYVHGWNRPGANSRFSPTSSQPMPWRSYRPPALDCYATTFPVYGKQASWRGSEAGGVCRRPSRNVVCFFFCWNETVAPDSPFAHKVRSRKDRPYITYMRVCSHRIANISKAKREGVCYPTSCPPPSRSDRSAFAFLITRRLSWTLQPILHGPAQPRLRLRHV